MANENGLWLRGANDAPTIREEFKKQLKVTLATGPIKPRDVCVG